MHTVNNIINKFFFKKTTFSDSLYKCGMNPRCLPFSRLSPLSETSTSALGSAVLVVSLYRWKSLQPQIPALTIKTTCTKAAMLDLPPG